MKKNLKCYSKKMIPWGIKEELENCIKPCATNSVITITRDLIVSPPNSYVEALTLNVMVFGEGIFER